MIPRVKDKNIASKVDTKPCELAGLNGRSTKWVHGVSARRLWLRNDLKLGRGLLNGFVVSVKGWLVNNLDTKRAAPNGSSLGQK